MKYKMKYGKFFEDLTDDEPFAYQSRLGIEPWPDLLDVPTGMGKTAAVIVAWLYKRLTRDRDTGRRLIYCLPMRVLVQQTADAARRWCQKAEAQFRAAGLDVPTVHLLLGGDVDEEWENSPEASAILIGTQDMLLSRALNRGYALTRYKWPVHFSLLNNDCLWAFDETQLIGVGIETSAQLDGLRRKLGTHGVAHSLWMSATLGETQLATVDHPKPIQGWRVQALQADDADNSRVQARIGAKKPIERLEGVCLDKESDKGGYVASVVDAIVKEHQARGGLTLVVVNRVQRAQAIYEALRKRGGSEDGDTALVHSRFRASDRARHEAVLHDKTRTRIVVATQAVEAGVDVSARTLFTELAPWSSLVQRLGRCNRYGGEQAAAFWLDIDTGDPKSGLPLPYEAAELDTARGLLEALAASGGDAGPQSLKSIEYVPPDVVRPVLRRKDLLDLFDTSPDLSGYDIDISRFVRDGDDTDVQFFWREYDSDPGDLSAPQREELCRVSVGAARDFIAKLGKRYDPSKSSTAVLRASRWNALERKWEPVKATYPGQVLLLHPSAGGYDAQLGWTGAVAPNRPVVAADPVSAEDGQDADESDPRSSFVNGRWVLLDDHLGHVRDESAALASSLQLADFEDALATAGLWHDVGKAHAAFQEKLLGPLRDRPGAMPEGVGPWAKSNHRLRVALERKHFRHELASALAWLAAGDAEDERLRNLVAYLVLAHHGKVRMSLRSLPGEARPDDPERLFARGVWDGDELPPFALPDGRRFEGVRLDLSVMRLGEGSWLERALTLRDAADLGPFRLALLETVVRVADWRASDKEQKGAYDA